MSGRVRRAVRELFGGGDDVFVGLLCEQVGLARRAAAALLDAQHDARAPAAVREDLHALAADGDEVRARLREELARALTTPIDPEDISRLSRAVDNVLDNLTDFAIELDVYGIAPDDRFTPLLEAVADGLDRVATAVGELGEDPADAVDPAREARRELRVRDAYHAAMGELLGGDEVTMTTLGRRELLRRLDVAGLRLGEALDALISGALKRR